MSDSNASHPSGVKSLDTEGLADVLDALGEPRYRTDQILRWLYARGAGSYEEMTDVSAGLREKLAGRLPITVPELVSRQESRDGTRKYLLRKVMGRLVPPSLLSKPKSGFSVPLGAWFAGPLRSLFEETVLDHGRCLEYLDAEAIRVLFDENSRGRRDHGIRLWAILVLENWLQSFQSGA